ncbi:MAG: DUF427 domain-containing protein [Sporichthyaceae bacterium]
MKQALWNGAVIAESNETVLVEGNHYFPPDAVRTELLVPVAKTTVCGWKGTANYYDLHVAGEVNAAAAWYYAEPFDAAKQIAGYVAFWRGVQVRDAA